LRRYLQHRWTKWLAEALRVLYGETWDDLFGSADGNNCLMISAPTRSLKVS
jgi:hypothetical protein